MNTACPRRVSLISALGLPTILSPTIGATSGDRPAARRFGSRLSPALQASSFARRLAHPHRPNRVHRGCPLGQPVLRTGRSRSVALHPALLRCSYGSIPHSSSPHRSGLSPLYPTALSGARARTFLSAAMSDEQTIREATGLCRRSGLAADKNVRAPALPALCSQPANHLDYCSAKADQPWSPEGLSLIGPRLEPPSKGACARSGGAAAVPEFQTCAHLRTERMVIIWCAPNHA